MVMREHTFILLCVLLCGEAWRHFAKVVLHVVLTQPVKHNCEVRNGVALSRMCHYVVILFLSSDYQFFLLYMPLIIFDYFST
jgi:hypothetical protein